MKNNLTGYYFYMNIESGHLFLSSGLYGRSGNPFKDSSSDRWFVLIGKA